MEDKTFELLTKMYSEFSKRFDGLEKGQKQLEEGQKQLENGQKQLEEGQKRLESRVGKIETLMENEFKSSMQAALEGYQMNYEKLKEHDGQLESIKNALEKQDLEITVIKGGKKKKLK